MSTSKGRARKSFEAVPSPDRSGKRLKTVARRSYLDMHRGTSGGQPRKIQVVKKVEEVRSGKNALNKVKNIKLKAKDKIPSTVLGQVAVGTKTQEAKDKGKKPKSIRFRFKLMRGGKRAKILSSPEKHAAKTSPVDKKAAKKNKAKELLAKARQRKVQDAAGLEGKRNVKMTRKYTDMMVTGVADMHFLHRTASPPPGERSPSDFTSRKASRKSLSLSPSPARAPRQFVLPQVSSRSSRVIKPSKRFIEEMGASSPPKKQPKFDIAMDMTREMKQEMLSSGDEFASPERSRKTVLKQKNSEEDTFVKPKSRKIVSSKFKKHSDKHLKAPKKSHDSAADADITEDDIEDTNVGKRPEEVPPDADGAVKTSKAFKLKSEKTKSLEKKKKEKLKAKKKKLQEKKEKAKQKKLEEKKRKKAKLLAKKKKRLKKSKSPKKKKDKVDDKEEPGESVEQVDQLEKIEGQTDGAIITESTEIVVDETKTGEKETVGEGVVARGVASSSKSEDKPKNVKSPRRIRKAMKKKLKEEAKQLKKTYTELKKSIERSEVSPVEGVDKVLVPPNEEALLRKKQLKELAKRHKEVCKALRKFQKEASAKVKKKKKDDMEAVTYKVIEDAPEREQKENLGPLRSPSELVKSGGILMDPNSTKAIAAFGKYCSFLFEDIIIEPSCLTLRCSAIKKSYIYSGMVVD